jgi:hypothetical protein
MVKSGFQITTTMAEVEAVVLREVPTTARPSPRTLGITTVPKSEPLPCPHLPAVDKEALLYLLSNA